LTTVEKRMTMETKLIFTAMLAMSLFSCTRSRYATFGAYESDDVYLSSSDTYIADFALVDNEAYYNPSIDSASTHDSSDDYYDPNYTAPPVYTPNSTAGNWQPDPWNDGYYNSGSSFNSGFGNYNYGSYWNPIPSPMMGISWTPYGGYMTNYSVGYTPYYAPSWGYNPYNSWYTPYYSPYYYSGWAYGPSNNGYSYYASGINDLPSIGRTIHGPRNPISAISGTSSSYSNGLFYNGSKRDMHAYVNQLEAAPKPAVVAEPASARPTSSFTHSERPAQVNDAAKPGRGNQSARPSATQPTSRPSSVNAENRPVRDERPEYENERVNNGRETRPSQQTEAPVRETPRSAPRAEPSRSMGGSPAPSRSGGGSTSSPRRK
jgi:hypothetical protein